MALGLALNFAGLNAVKMLFWSAVINGLLAPPLILLVILLTSSQKVMGKRVNSPLLRYLGWATFGNGHHGVELARASWFVGHGAAPRCPFRHRISARSHEVQCVGTCTRCAP